MPTDADQLALLEFLHPDDQINYAECAAIRYTLALIERYRAALEELVEVADLRWDSVLPHPADDPKLWTARMQAAWDNAHVALSPDPAPTETEAKQ